MDVCRGRARPERCVMNRIFGTVAGTAFILSVVGCTGGDDDDDGDAGVFDGGVIDAGDASFDTGAEAGDAASDAGQEPGYDSGGETCQPNCLDYECDVDPVCGTLSCGECEEGFECRSGFCRETVALKKKGEKCVDDDECLSENCRLAEPEQRRCFDDGGPNEPCSDRFDCEEGTCLETVSHTGERQVLDSNLDRYHSRTAG